MKRQIRKGFTLLDLLVAVAIFALLITIMIPSLARARELENRKSCSANLHGIMESMVLYAAEMVTDGGGTFPCVIPTAATPGKTYLVQTVQVQSIPPATSAILALTDMQLAAPSANIKGSPTAGLWMLVLRGQCAPKNFLCKSDGFATVLASLFTAGTSPTYYEDFGASNISYAIAMPWNDSGGNGPWFEDIVDSTVPYLADMPPAQEQIFSNTKVNVAASNATAAASPAINSPNHAGDGQNVAYGDVHVEFRTNPSCGPKSDNIYTVSATDGQPDPLGTAPGAGSINTVLSTTTAPFDIEVVPQRANTGKTY